jgi:predicted secreted protein
MTVTWVDISHNERAGQRSLGLDRATRDAMATYSRTEWPTNTAKHAAREWDLSLDEARGVVAGRASQATIDKVFKHQNGGWRVVLPVLGSVIGHGVDAFFRQQMIQAAKAAAHAEEHERLAQAAYRRLEARPADPREDRGQGSGARAVGSEEARRLG